MATTRGRTRASQAAEGEEEAAAAATRERSRSASPLRTPPPYRQRTSTPPSQPQEMQGGSDSGHSDPSPPPRRVIQPDRIHANSASPPPAYFRERLARLARDRADRDGGDDEAPAATRPILRPATRIPRAVPLEDPFVDTPGRPRPAVEGFNPRPPPPLTQAMRRRARRRSMESPTRTYVRRRESRRAGRQPRHGVRQETPDSEEEDYGSDRTTGSTETDDSRPGFGPLPRDVGIVETDPTRVLPTIEEGRDPILALEAQRASFQVNERTLTRELGSCKDLVDYLARQLEEARALAVYHLHNSQRLAEEHRHLQARFRALDQVALDFRRELAHVRNEAANPRGNIAEDRRAPVEEERPRIYDEMGNESPEGPLGDNTANLRPLRQAPQGQPQLVENQAREIRRLGEARRRAVDELSAERALREAQADEIRELNARIQHLEGRVAEQNDQIEQNTAQGNGRTASVANDIPPQTTNSQQALDGPQAAVPAQQVNAPPQQPQGQRRARRGREQAPTAAPPQQPQGQRPRRGTRQQAPAAAPPQQPQGQQPAGPPQQQAPAAAPPVRRLPARACKNNVKSYKEPRGR